MKTLGRLFLSALLSTVLAFAQVPVTLAPPLHPQFWDANGALLSGGFLFSYQAGTTTLQATYADSLGIAQNPNPIALDSSGAPSNGTVQVSIFLANQSYKFCAQNSFGVQQWCMDNVSGYLGLLNLANTWTFPQIFTQPITITPADNQIITGAAGNQTTLDFPPPTGNQILHFPSTTDTVVARNTTDTLTAKTLVNAALTTPTVNGCGLTNAPATYLCIANAASGTGINLLAKLVNAPAQAATTAITDTKGIVGVVVNGAGTTGTAIIQQSGVAGCSFDNPTVTLDYVTSSATSIGACHDAGATPPAGVQVLGQVMATGGGGVVLVDFNGPGIITSFTTGVTLPNDTVTGTALNALAKQTLAPTKAIKTSLTDTFGAIGIVASGNGIAGSASIQQQGLAQCAFDNATTANDYVVISAITAGDCHDTGTAPPALPPGGVQLLGQVLSTNIASGTFQMNLYGPGLIPPVQAFAPQSASTAGLPVAITANVQITVLTKSVTFPSVPGTYRADIRSGIWITAGPNACASEVVDVTNAKAFASANAQNANGAGLIGLAGAQITSSQTYAPGDVRVFNLAVICNANSTATLNWALGTATLSPNAGAFLDITPLWSN